MGLIFRNDISQELKQSLHRASYMELVTAYLSSGIFSILEGELSDKDISLYIRGNKSDFFSGSVCIETLRALYDMGIKCYLVRNLHAKIYIFDNKTMYIGSANLTNNGLSISASSNIEVLYKTEYSEDYGIELRRSLQYAQPLSEDILQEIETVTAETDPDEERKNLDIVDWSFWTVEDYAADLSPSLLPWCDCSENLEEQDYVNYHHDKLLFGLQKDGSFNRSLFITSTLHHFLVKVVIERENQYIYFRDLKAILEDSFDLPTRDARNYAKNIFSYYRSKICLPLVYDRPNFSECLRLQL